MYFSTNVWAATALSKNLQPTKSTNKSSADADISEMDISLVNKKTTEAIAPVYTCKAKWGHLFS